MSSITSFQEKSYHFEDLFDNATMSEMIAVGNRDTTKVEKVKKLRC
jgi:hypothetical protein